MAAEDVVDGAAGAIADVRMNLVPLARSRRMGKSYCCAPVDALVDPKRRWKFDYHGVGVGGDNDDKKARSR